MNEIFQICLGFGITIGMFYMLVFYVVLIEDIYKNYKSKKENWHNREDYYTPMKWQYFIPGVYFFKYM